MEVETQLNKIASMASSDPMEGSAILTAELIKVVMNELMGAISKATLLLLVLFKFNPKF